MQTTQQKKWVHNIIRDDIMITRFILTHRRLGLDVGNLMTFSSANVLPMMGIVETDLEAPIWMQYRSMVERAELAEEHTDEVWNMDEELAEEIYLFLSQKCQINSVQ